MIRANVLGRAPDKNRQIERLCNRVLALILTVPDRARPHASA